MLTEGCGIVTDNTLFLHRMRWLFKIIIFCLIVILVRMVWIQLIKSEDYRNLALFNRIKDYDIEAERGNFYDRHGAALTANIKAQSLYVVPSRIKKEEDVQKIAKALGEILEINQGNLEDILRRNTAFHWVRRKISDEQVEAIKSLGFPGIGFIEESKRVYPKEYLASQILGFVGLDHKGLNGLEFYFEKELRGIPGKMVIETDSSNRPLHTLIQDVHDPIDGNDIIFTIDETNQYITERELERVVTEERALRGTAIIMEIKTGEILAMANYPTFNPNNFGQYDRSSWRNFAITDTYEPGSTFKNVVAAGVLEEKVVSQGEIFNDPGYIRIGQTTIRSWRAGGHGKQTLAQALGNSSNPIFAEIALRQGKDSFYKYLHGFGFGRPTGIDFPGEAAGILVPKGRATNLDLATMSIGQANTVTPLQLITANAAIANDGWLMKPLLVKEIRDKDGNTIKAYEPEPIRQVISRDTARDLRMMLESVVIEGTGQRAQIEGYRVAGKSGTAQKPLPGGGYSSSDFIASFISFAPADQPVIACLIVIDSPRGSYHGGQIASPVVRRILENVLRYLQIPPEISR